jgi:hypothetical protein
MESHPSCRARIPAVFAACLFLGIFYTGCSTSPEGSRYKNIPPRVWISGGPPQGGVSNYKIDFSWGGWDPEGEIVYYEYCITNNNGSFDPADTTGPGAWQRTKETGDTFVFSADELADSVADSQVEEFRRSHTFLVRAVDNDGAVSDPVAHRSFTATTLSPEVEITFPKPVGLNPAMVPHIFTIRWRADDYIGDGTTRQDPDSVSWILEPLSSHNYSWDETTEWIRNLPLDAPEWGAWKAYEAGGTGEMAWTTPPTDHGDYIFAIRAKDEAGAITPVFEASRNVLRVYVKSDWAFHFRLTLWNEHLGSLVSGMSMCTAAAPAIVDMPPGVPIRFYWTADARDYSGTAFDYRYGWDVADPNDPSQWELDWIPFPPHAETELPWTNSTPRQFYYGTHVFSVQVRDYSGTRACREVKFNILQAPFDRPLLLVDDYDEGSPAGWDVTSGTDPSDGEHDAFWMEALSDVDGFSPETDVLETTAGEPIPLSLLLRYKSIVWSVRGDVPPSDDYPVLRRMVRFVARDAYYGAVGKLEPDILASYMAAGGHVLICGQRPVSMAIATSIFDDIRLPILFAYELDASEDGSDRPPGPWEWGVIDGPVGRYSFPYRDLCVETMDLAATDLNLMRRGADGCPVEGIRTVPADNLRLHTMRAAVPLDLNFPRLDLRPETAAPGKAHAPENEGLNVEVYDPGYFYEVCDAAGSGPRDCFEPIYGLECLDTGEPTYGQAVAFWTSTYADVKAEVPGTIAARSAVFGFPPVYFGPEASRVAIEYVLFDEWRLPRR